MKTSIVVLSSFVLASSAAVADTGLLEAVGKQAVQNSANAVAPDAVKGVEAAGAAVDSAKAVKAGVENTPAAAKQQVEDAAKQAVKQKIEQATPEELKQGAQLLKEKKQAVKQLKSQVEQAPNAEQAIKAGKAKAKQKAAEKALDLLQ
ncbi:hypothetical protein [Methylomonas sp. CM2]|uniref:hypothetical protein n=1 Tax=Methylomonas sp. CM2 TaxID=3417647 RepID=UPI003CEEBBC4